jgi:hypothetical protein
VNKNLQKIQTLILAEISASKDGEDIDRISNLMSFLLDQITQVNGYFGSAEITIAIEDAQEARSNYYDRLENEDEED